MKLFKIVGNYAIYDSIGKGQFGSVHLSRKTDEKD